MNKNNLPNNLNLSKETLNAAKKGDKERNGGLAGRWGKKTCRNRGLAGRWGELVLGTDSNIRR